MILWDWAVAAYAAPGVAETCLHLQDAADQNVPLLLWAAWCARSGRPLDADTIEAGCDTARAWNDAAIAPLRAVRRTLKTPLADIQTPDREAVREAVKALELDCERRLLLALEALSPTPLPASTDPLPALVAVSRAWSRMIPRAGLTDLAEQLPA
jgi:uncharacterized protein (TIGR02444 family)